MAIRRRHEFDPAKHTTDTEPSLDLFYKLTPQLRLGALVGRIADQSHRDRGANGAAVTAYYDLSKRTMLLGQVETLRNDGAGHAVGFDLAREETVNAGEPLA